MERIAVDITEKVLSKVQKSEVELEPILSPDEGSVVLRVAESGEVIPVRIVSGQLWGTHGLSNFWYWINLKTGEEEHGYGSFCKMTVRGKCNGR